MTEPAETQILNIPGVIRCRPRQPVYLYAIQWTGDNYAVMDMFTVHGFNVDEDGTGRIWSRHRSKIERVPVGAYVALGVTGELFTMDAEGFVATYEAVP